MSVILKHFNFLTIRIYAYGIYAYDFFSAFEFQSNLVAERLEEELMGYEEAAEHNKTEYVLDAISKFADGFSVSYLETVANKALPKICIKMSPIRSRPKVIDISISILNKT